VTAQGSGRFYVETLGCPKNQVDSDKIVGTLLHDGLSPTDDPSAAEVVVVNTCAFIEEARKESIGVILQLNELRPSGSRLVVTGSNNGVSFPFLKHQCQRWTC
jgi:ribosomal protein S12 methylthiotransferase